MLGLFERKDRKLKIDKRTPVTEASYVVVDTELTGLDEKRDSIVSIGAVRMTGARIELGDTFYRLVSPRTELGSDSVVIHEITPSEVAEQPSIETVLDELLAAVSSVEPDAAAELVQLGKAEAFRVLDNHYGCFRHVDADLDHRGRDQHVQLVPAEGAHHRVLLLLLHAAVEQAHPRLGELRLEEHRPGGLAEVRLQRHHVGVPPGEGEERSSLREGSWRVQPAEHAKSLRASDGGEGEVDHGPRPSASGRWSWSAETGRTPW